MYRLFYSLKSKPFQISSDPDFLWLGEKHKEALATLRYGILDNKGFLLLTGDVGTGKTTLINTLIGSLGNDVICTSVPDPNLTKIDFFNYVARGFGMDHEVTSKGQFIVWFSHFLHTAYANKKKVLLIVDESQLLTQELLEEIRLLSNVERAETKLLNIFFVGQNELNEILSRPQNRAVRQRLTINYNLEPLSITETSDYIKYRLEIAGTTKRLFTDEAVREIYFDSKGFPRRINVLCDHALLTGFVKDKLLIGADIIKECARELDIPISKKQSNIEDFKEDIQSEPDPLPQALVKTPETKRQGWFPAFVVSVIIFLLVLGGSLLFPDRFQSFLEDTRVYLKSCGVNISNSLSGTILSAPISSRDVIKGDIESYPINNSPEIPALKKDMVQEESGEQLDRVPQDPEIGDGKRDGADLAGESLDKVLPGPETLNLAKREIEPQFEVVPPVLEDHVVVRFSYNTNDFTDKGLEDLNRFADALVFYPKARLSIKGYTDSNGNKLYNRQLSEFRANIVKSFLLGKGAMVEQIETHGLGSDNPIGKNDSNSGRQLNRRVEIEVISKGEPFVNKN